MKTNQEMEEFWTNIDFNKVSDIKLLKSNTVNTTFAINKELLKRFKTSCKDKGISCTDVYLKAVLNSMI